MEKQKLADLVLQKMKQKKEQENRNRPHYEVLRLEATFQKEIHDHLKQEISQLQSLINNERQVLNELQKHQNQLQNTGKKNYPRIVIMPDFIASEKISYSIKEFYRKTSNSFLRTDILRTKAYNQSVVRQKEFLQKLALIEQLENQIRNNVDQDRKILNQKRIRVLKEDLRLRSIKQQQQEIKRTIQKEREENKDLIKQYDIKKNNIQNRKDRLKYVSEQILIYKKKIQQAFNPVSYREHLQSVFDIQMKTQRMNSHLAQVVKKTGTIEKETEKYEKILQKTASLSVLGRTSDSPSTKRGKIQKRLHLQKQRSKQNVKRALTQRLGRDQTHKRSMSNQSIKKQSLDLDLLQIVSTAKNSQRTTDRSTHPGLYSQLARSLF